MPGDFLHEVSAILPDGRGILIPGDAYGVAAEMRPEWIFQTQPILAFELGEVAADTLAELPHLRRWYGTRGAGPGPVGVKGRAGGYRDGFAWARNDRAAVEWYDGSGRRVQVARWAEDAVPLDAAWRRRMAEATEDAFRSRGADDATVRSRLARLDEGLDRYDGAVPFWQQFHVDRVGNVWLSAYVLSARPPERWRRVHVDGHVEWIELPGVIDILDATEDRVLAVRLNEVDVPAAVMFELVGA